MRKRMPMVTWFLDSPQITQPAANPDRFEVSGWIAGYGAIESIRFADEESARLLPVSRVDRPDVTATYGIPAAGFSASCRYADIAHRPYVTLLFTHQGRDNEIVIPVRRPATDLATLKAEKLRRIRGILQCPVCAAHDFDERDGALHCGACANAFPRSPDRFDFLTRELRSEFGIVDTDNVSAMSYDGVALNFVHRLTGGTILDCGAGLRDRYFANVVNLEIVPYETTDVLGVGERLPFQDASFDAVFSFAVLEHVKDPFACSREMMRVLKPGGSLYCQVPFLQPVHGYPHHYYNCTLQGARGLFGDAIDIEREGPFLFGQPIVTLSWFLNRYLAGLPENEHAAFKAMRVEDLMKPPYDNLGAAFVERLTDAAREELSSCNAIIATRRAGVAPS